MQGDFEYQDALVDGRPPKGRGAGLNPGNRYEQVRLHVLGDHLDAAARAAGAEDSASAGRDDPASGGPSTPPGARPATQVIHDHPKTILNPVDSDDLGFKWSLNPYRGCEHGCIYCYARPDHERLGMSCGLDFETKILAKTDAPTLLRRELASGTWRPAPIMMAGVTDCYQPLERKLGITRGCLEVLAEARQPVGIVTKSRLILRDLDLLAQLASHRAVRVAVSVTTLESKLAAKMEPRASSPADRLRAIEALAGAGVLVGVMVAPIIAGLTDRETPAILQAAAEAGATSAGYVFLRLPHQIKALFLDWLAEHMPDRAGHVERLIRDTRGGKLYDARWRVRQRGAGPVAQQIEAIFKTFARRYGLDGGKSTLSTAHFRRPTLGGQGSLF